jgi:hypothetical protein
MRYDFRFESPIFTGHPEVLEADRVFDSGYGNIDL